MEQQDMPSELITIQVVLALPDQQQLIEFAVPEGSLAREVALQSEQHGLLITGTGIDIATVPLGVFGEVVDDNYVLNANDRIELYRPLLQDPKELRRQRARTPEK